MTKTKSLLIIILSIFFAASFSYSEPYWYNCTELTGGGDYALDNISGVRLNDGDVAVVLTSSGHTYFYVLDADSAQAESSPFYISPDNVAGDKRWVLQNIIWNSNVQTFTDTDATPSVSGGKIFITVGTTSITDFDNGITGQIIHVIANSSITITDGTNIFLSGSTNFAMVATDTLTLICQSDNKWYELARSDNT